MLHRYTTSEQHHHTTSNGYALDTFQVVTTFLPEHYRQLVNMVETDLARTLDTAGELPELPSVMAARFQSEYGLPAHDAVMAGEAEGGSPREDAEREERQAGSQPGLPCSELKVLECAVAVTETVGGGGGASIAASTRRASTSWTPESSPPHAQIANRATSKTTEVVRIGVLPEVGRRRRRRHPIEDDNT